MGYRMVLSRFLRWRGEDYVRKAVVLYLIYRLRELGVPVTEKKLQKLMFIVSYIDRNGYFEKREVRALFDDYRIAWHGVFSGRLRDILNRLSSEGLVLIERDETATDIALTEKGARKARDLAMDLDRYLREKIDYVVDRYGMPMGDELAELINEWLGISGAEAGSIKALLFGTRIEDLIEVASSIE